MHIDNVIIVLRELGSDKTGVGLLVARDIVALQHIRETSDVHGDHTERSAGGGGNMAHKASCGKA